MQAVEHEEHRCEAVGCLHKYLEGAAVLVQHELLHKHGKTEIDAGPKSVQVEQDFGLNRSEHK